jgi:ribonuclease P protein component
MRPQHRLRKNEDFSEVFAKGRSVADSLLVIYHLRKDPGEPYRVGFSVGKKLGGAVIRNRYKRILREIVRTNGEHIPSGIDLVVIARQGILEKHYTEIENSFKKLMKKASLWK